MISHLFKLPRHRTFGYKPRYYDPLKEDFKRRLMERKGLEADAKELENVEVPIHERISIKDNYINRKYAERKETRVRIYIRLVTIALLLLVVYMLFDVVVKMY